MAYVGNFKFDTNIESLNVSGCRVRGIMNLAPFTQLKELVCMNNEITGIINFPESLEMLNCHKNKIEYLPNLPAILRVLDCRNNFIRNLDDLPMGLE